MPDSRFFRRAGPFPFTEIGTRAGAIVAMPGTPGLFIGDVAAVAAAGASDLTYVAQSEYLSALSSSRCGACIVKQDWVSSAPKGAAVLVAANPRAAFAEISALFYPDIDAAPGGAPPEIAAD